MANCTIIACLDHRYYLKSFLEVMFNNKNILKYKISVDCFFNLMWS